MTMARHLAEEACTHEAMSRQSPIDAEDLPFVPG
jgi:hypothetical protein